MNIEILIMKLLSYYQIKTLNDLAIKLDTTQSTISGWKARNAIGALTDTVANKDPEALEFIFTNNSKSQHIGSITNSNIANDVQNQNYGTNKNYTDTDEATFSLYKEAYKEAKDNEKIKEFRIHLMSFKSE
ncbi:hypothetical protein [Aliarcobacter butzleri]|uniref:hypothetical protein n=1 Tax=Aliarcobacter butzleri TaxID=28197 RepID=UPI0002295CD1|nr:hypothetical protein [Aliarcobacter butzleri]MCG3687725.1 hypothetical protein [Aliarcobacter butzleri]BAK70971.1 conserved hypothetical protein [Aliarcobacter butzleri ED-1]